MLAPNYMTAADLQISDELHSALIKLLGMFERSELRHALYQDGFIPENTKNGFNLAVGLLQNECETIGCFAGWASVIIGCSLTDVLCNLPTLQLARLFYGNSNWFSLPTYRKEFPLSKVNVEQAEFALRNYLTVGDPKWEDVLQ